MQSLGLDLETGPAAAALVGSAARGSGDHLCPEMFAGWLLNVPATG